MVDTPLTIRSPSIWTTFWNTPWVAGWVGPRLRVINSSCGSLSTKTGLLLDILLMESFIFFNLPSKKIIFLVHSVWIFQWMFLSHGESFHIINIQDATQIRVTGKSYTIKVICLAFHPISPVP